MTAYITVVVEELLTWYLSYKKMLSPYIYFFYLNLESQ